MLYANNNVWHIFCNVFFFSLLQVLFFKEIQKSLSKFAQEKFIIGGDFNCALAPSDKEGGNPTSKKQSVIKEIDNLCHLYSLYDIWRSLNPTAKQFTWRNKSFKVQCRLDYFLISKELSSTTIKCDILYAPNTDHSAIQLHLLSEELKQQKGPGFWKFNSSLLEDKKYISDLRENLTNFIEKYRDVEDLGLKWDLVKMEIRGFSVKFSKIKARRRRDEEVFLQKKINELFTKAEKNRNNRQIICELNSTRARLEKIMALKTRGTIIRSRARWHEQGERNNKYFLNLEKRNHSRNLVSKLKLPNDSVITNQFDILEEQGKFYKSLYTSQHAENVKKPEDGVFFNPSNISALSDHEQALCEGLITENEAFKALKEFAAQKTPGTDGLLTEFLKFFWPELKSLIVESFNYAFLNGSLSISQRRGIISLIPKKNKDKTILENLRPISLLNVDYKILTKVLANRLEKVLPKIINPDQTGYVKGRYIGENIRLIQDLMFHLDKENSPGIAVFVDFRKAFDTIEWNYLKKALTLFNFGPDFLQWFKTVYSNISSCILNNGHASHFFSLTRGVKQGCPLSGLLFVIGLDLLARAIKNHDLIKGITIRNHEIKTTMYADDTTVFLSHTESVPHLLELLNQFKVVSGLEVNSTKTEAMWLGKWKNRCDTPFNFKWPVDPICALGVFFSYDTIKADKLNFDEKLRSMEKVLNIWKNRKLTLIGRINIVKTLVLSKLIFNSSNLSLPKDLPDTINNMILNFIWEGKPPKIKKTTVIGHKNKGGLKMIDFKVMETVLKISWINRIHQNSSSSWKILNSRLLDLNNAPPFYQVLLKHWQENKHIISEDNIKRQNEIIWNNKNILMNKHMIYLKQWHQSGITFISDLLDDDFGFLSHTTFQQTFQLKIPFTTYYGLINAIPPSWRCEIKAAKDQFENENASQESPLHNVINTRSVYAAIMDHYFQPPTAEQRLLRYGFSKESLKNVYNFPFAITTETKLQIFQYKIIHNILPTRYSLFRMNLCDSETCHLCKTQPQTLPHLLYRCPKISNFWTAFQKWWTEKQQKTITLSERDILYGWHDNAIQTKDILNYISLVAKYYIFCTTQDCDGVPFDGFPPFLKNRLDTLQHIAVRNKTINIFELKWKDFM